MRRIGKIGLVILVAGIMTLGYGGLCKKDSHHDTTSGSSYPDYIHFEVSNYSADAYDIYFQDVDYGTFVFLGAVGSGPGTVEMSPAQVHLEGDKQGWDCALIIRIAEVTIDSKTFSAMGNAVIDVRIFPGGDLSIWEITDDRDR